MWKQSKERLAIAGMRWAQALARYIQHAPFPLLAEIPMRLGDFHPAHPRLEMKPGGWNAQVSIRLARPNRSSSG